MCYSSLIIRRDIERKDFFLFLAMNYTCWVRRVGSARQSLSRAFLMFINAGAFRLFSLRLNFSSFFFHPPRHLFAQLVSVHSYGFAAWRYRRYGRHYLPERVFNGSTSMKFSLSRRRPSL